MSCYKPLLGLWRGEYHESGKRKYHIEGNLNPFDAPLDVPHVVIPCGKCIGCRLDYSRQWADRMMLELDTSGCGVFLTLTYNDTTLYDLEGDHAHFTSFKDDMIGEFASLRKRDWQLFMKSLRHEFEPKRIRFYACGEYGEKNFRPHMHAIIFGLSLDDFPDRVEIGKNELGDKYYKSGRLSKVWQHGFSLLADVSWNTCAYVARYVTKKQNGVNAIKYALMNVEPEFALMSRRPGIGAEYLEQHPDALDYSNINISTDQGGRKIAIPKYYLRKLELTDPDMYDKIKKDRMEFANDKMLLKLQKTGLDYLDYLEVEEQNKKHSVKVLGRSKTD